jgi:hypothetical protein
MGFKHILKFQKKSTKNIARISQVLCSRNAVPWKNDFFCAMYKEDEIWC